MIRERIRSCLFLFKLFSGRRLEVNAELRLKTCRRRAQLEKRDLSCTDTDQSLTNDYDDFDIPCRQFYFFISW